MTKLKSKTEEMIAFDKEHSGNLFVIGTDEAGRGPGAGPVYSAAVHFEDLTNELVEALVELDDSKKLTENKKNRLYDVIRANSIYSIKSCSVEEIEKINILQASLLSMKKACEEVEKQLKCKVKVLVDGRQVIPRYEAEQQNIIKGDSKSLSIAAASVLAKVARDRHMVELSKKYPYYAWEKNKGYLTKAHLEAIEKHGVTVHHRKKFLRKFEERAEQKSLFG